MTASATVKDFLKRYVAPPVEQVLHQVRYNRSPLGRRLLERQQRAQVERWKKAGRPAPPPDLIKHDVIRSYAQRFRLRAMVETGTFVGDTPDALHQDFD